MQKLSKFVCWISLIVMAVSVPLSADSLWETGKGTLYGATKKEVQVGDVVTIYISESTSAAQQATTQTSKASEMGSNLLSNWDLISNVFNESAHRNYELQLKVMILIKELGRQPEPVK